MFRPSLITTEPQLFNSFIQNLSGARLKKFEDPKQWHNVFREQIIVKIEEKPFHCLYSPDNGSPNSSIRILIGLMILKEAFGCSDKLLFERLEFDILVMSSLGLTNMDDKAVSPATYYNFRAALYEHQIQTGEDLVGNVFKQFTKEQAKFFGVSGEFTRMDSKLMGSNIAKNSRLELIINVLQVFYKDIKKDGALTYRLSAEDVQLLEGLLKRKAGNQVYEMDCPEREKMLETLGYLLNRLHGQYNDSESKFYHLLTRILSEQYYPEGEKIMLKKVEEIKSDSLQSPYDEDAAYRKKGEGNDAQKVSGYSINITETCNDDSLNLITDVKVEKANYADKDFFQGAIERSESVVGHINHSNTDGAYHSPENQEFAKANNTELIVGNLSGKPGLYYFQWKDDKTLFVTNTATKEVHQAEEYKEGKYRIREGGKIRYFTLAMVQSNLQRQQIENTSKEALNRRNNVEAAMFQVSYYTRKTKTRYRTEIKHQWWATNRCAWMNLVRIKNWMGEVCPHDKNPPKSSKKQTNQGKTLKDFVVFLVQGIMEAYKMVFYKPKLEVVGSSILMEKKYKLAF